MDEVLRALRRARRPLVTSHARPDGDAVGSVLACWRMLRQMGADPEMILSDRVPVIYRNLPGASQIRQTDRVVGDFDAVVLLECDSAQRSGLCGLDGRLLINIDHHASGQPFAAINWIESGACAVAEMIYRLCLRARLPITPEMANCLYAAVLTDTGSFCYDKTDRRTFELAAKLTACGADPAMIAQEVYFSFPASKMRLLGAALCNLRCEGRFASLWVTRRDMERTGAAEEDCEGIVNYAIAISGIDAAVFLRELPGGGVRLSLRSKTGIDVAAIAERFGGGGHENASGCTVQGPLEAAIETIVDELRRQTLVSAAPGGLLMEPVK